MFDQDAQFLKIWTNVPRATDQNDPWRNDPVWEDAWPKVES